MNNPIYQFFTNDHRRVEAILERAIKTLGQFDMDAYQAFRVGLLTHIKMEEKVLFPAAQKANNDEPIPLANKLRLEHGAITSLMVPPPTADLVTVLKYVLEKHDILEEEEGGMYEICEKLTKQQTDELLASLQNTPEVPLLRHNNQPFALEAAKRALLRAGYDFDEIVANHKLN